ncbi:hypothetical protein N431DRAFT_18330 [Stipitochalara longipes BDJ]|nr:hypothetical protein N431DRAFT_18330 [Stipitochalara longipes BDJ]
MENLFERYSTLGLSYATDRPRAIVGLEKRLMTALQSAGGYGIFQPNFHRGLLWHRQRSQVALKRIKFEPQDRVPSWSWLAFDGQIRYMYVPFGETDKAEDIVSPFEGLIPGAQYAEASLGKPAELRAPVRTFKLAGDMKSELILDERDCQLVEPFKCVIVRASKESHGGRRTPYALVISFLGVEVGVDIYEGAGVASVDAAEIEPLQDREYVRIR